MNQLANDCPNCGNELVEKSTLAHCTNCNSQYNYKRKKHSVVILP
jgi:DNA-directed RNA polymerase subunit M/transcription elongation factor TFIIS